MDSPMETPRLPRAAALALARHARGEIDFMEGKKLSGLGYRVWLELVLEAGLPGFVLGWDEHDIEVELRAIEQMKRERGR